MSNITQFLDPRFLLDAAQTLFIALLWLRKPGVDAGQKADAVAARLDLVEERMKHLPDSPRVNALEGGLREIKAMVQAVEDRQDAQGQVLGRIETFLLNSKL